MTHIRRIKPAKPGDAYAQMWRIIDGAISECFRVHPDYLPKKQSKTTIRASLVKRVTGAVIGYAAQAAQARSAKAAGETAVCFAKEPRLGLGWKTLSHPAPLPCPASDEEEAGRAKRPASFTEALQ